MTPRERLLNAIRGEEVDRAPLVLPGLMFRTRAAVDQCPDPYKRSLAQRVFEHSTWRWNVPSFINRYLVTPPQRMAVEAETVCGGRRRTTVIDTPRGPLRAVTEWDPQAGTTWTVRYPVERREDIDKIASIPWERPPGLAPPDLSGLPDEFEERGIVFTGVSSPFVCVAGMMPYQMFLELCATDLPLIQELTEICRRRILDVLDVLFSKPGIEYVWIGGSEWVTPPMGSPALYDALVQEQERSLIGFIKERSEGRAVVHVHCHGHVRHALMRTIERGADYTEPVEPPPDGDITMAEAKAAAAGRITLGGNVEARVLYNGTEVEVEQACLAAFAGGKHRFVFRPTEGPSPRMTEREYRNYARMIEVWEELSPIDGQAS